MSDREFLETFSYGIKKLPSISAPEKIKILGLIQKRMIESETLWSEENYVKIFELLSTSTYKISEIKDKIDNAIDYVNKNLTSFSLEELASIRLFSFNYYPELSDLHRTAFIDKFVEYKDIHSLNFPEIGFIANALTAEFDKIELTPKFIENFTIYTEHLCDIVDSNYFLNRTEVSDLCFYYFSVPLVHCQSLQQTIAAIVANQLFNSGEKFSMEKFTFAFNTIKSMKIKREIQHFLAKKLFETSSPLLYKNAKIQVNSNFNYTHEKLLILLFKIKLFYPQYIIAFFNFMTSNERNRVFSLEVLVSLAYFNFFEIAKFTYKDEEMKRAVELMRYNVNESLNQLQNSWKMLESGSLLTKNDIKKASSIVWCCSVFNFHESLQMDILNKVFNECSVTLSFQNSQKLICVQNWIKYELNKTDIFEIPKLAYKKEEYSDNEGEEAVYSQEFKQEVRRKLSSEFIEDYSLDGMVIDFACPQTKTAIFLNTDFKFVTYENELIPVENMIIIERVLKKLDWKVEKLSVYNYLYSKNILNSS